MTYKLLFGVFWILVGGGVFYWEHWSGETKYMLPLGNNRHISSAWFAFLLALYNLVGWWNYRTARARERAEATIEQKKYARGRRKNLEEQPNPDFDFKNPPPSPG
jgi:hypothetical protein